MTVTLLAAATRADDWPQWRGPDRNGISREQGWLDAWPAKAAPRIAWRTAVGKGHAAVAVSGGKVYTTGWNGSQDAVFCFDAESGRRLWRQAYPCAGIKQWPGPRATPTVADGVVYTLSQHGHLHAFDAVSGKRKWGVKLPASYNPDEDYGFAWSPLVAGDRLVLGCGKTGLAVNRTDGSFAWGNDGQHGACASATPFVWQGRKLFAMLTTNPGRDNVTIVVSDAATGKPVSRSDPWPEKWGAACVDVLAHDGKLFLTTAEQHLRCARFSIVDDRLKEDWSNNKLAVYTGGCVLIDGHLYGVNRNGILKCLDWKTGQEKWSRRDFGQRGTLIAADGKLLIQTGDSGELVVVEANPTQYRELRRAKVFSGDPATFTPPVLANGRVFCRSYAGEIVCLDSRRK